MKTRTVFLLASLLIFLPHLTLAQSCPTFIGDPLTGALYKNTKKVKQFPFKCYSNKRTATKSGFVPVKVESSLTGWWRVAVTSVSDSCDTSFYKGDTVNMFIQLKEDSTGIYGEVCPTNTQFHGSRGGNHSILVSNYSSTPTLENRCNGGEMEVISELKISNFKMKDSHQASYKIKYRCLGEDSEASVCAQKWEGVAFHERHTIWPTVPSNINKFPSGCGLALKTCSSCH